MLEGLMFENEDIKISIVFFFFAVNFKVTEKRLVLLKSNLMCEHPESFSQIFQPKKGL